MVKKLLVLVIIVGVMLAALPSIAPAQGETPVCLLHGGDNRSV